VFFVQHAIIGDESVDLSTHEATEGVVGSAHDRLATHITQAQRIFPRSRASRPIGVNTPEKITAIIKGLTHFEVARHLPPRAVEGTEQRRCRECEDQEHKYYDDPPERRVSPPPQRN
jgi:hypothetical protein